MGKAQKTGNYCSRRVISGLGWLVWEKLMIQMLLGPACVLLFVLPPVQQVFLKVMHWFRPWRTTITDIPPSVVTYSEDALILGFFFPYLLPGLCVSFCTLL